MGNVTKLFAFLGLTAAVGLSVFDFITSIMGVQQIMGEGNRSVIPVTMPYLFAALAISFNAISAHIFRMYLQKKFSSFASTVTFVMWIGFLTFDGASSLVGLVSTYTNTPVHSWHTMLTAFRSLDPLAGAFTIVMGILLSFGPFLASLFSDLAFHNKSNEGRTG